MSLCRDAHFVRPFLLCGGVVFVAIFLYVCLSMRFAYLIIAHNEPTLFRTLVRLLDDPRNDIFVHIDKRADARQFRSVVTKHSGLYFIDNQTVNWGG